MELLSLAHVLGDFYFQTNQMAERKRNCTWQLLVHGIIYAVTILGTISLLFGKIPERRIILTIGGIGAVHIIIDYVKNHLEKWFEKKNISPVLLFVVDQIIHISVLYVFWENVLLANTIINVAGIIGEKAKWDSVLLAILICGRPSAILIELGFNQMDIFKSDTAQEESSIKGGRWIGILEREMIVMLGLVKQYDAMAFVLAAKSIARYQQLDNKDFAEKYLIGTLLSALIAMTCTICIL